jgi:hypothetical protein
MPQATPASTPTPAAIVPQSTVLPGQPADYRGEPATHSPPGRTRRVVSFLLGALTGGVIGIGATFTATTLTEVDHPVTPSVAATVITIQNKVALGSDRLVEDTTPAYLSARPEPFCASHGCKVAGTEVSSNAMFVAVCYLQGIEMFNYNLDSSESKTNPNRVVSSRWYRAVLPDGRSGYISEVYLTPGSRGGLGLPVCGT